MRTFGIILLICGAIGLVIAFRFDTTVTENQIESKYEPSMLRDSETVHTTVSQNIGLISDREAGLIASATACVVGTLFIIAAVVVVRLDEIAAHGLAIRAKLTKENEETYRAVKNAL